MNINKQNKKITVILAISFACILNILSIDASSDAKPYQALYSSSPFGIARSTLSSSTYSSTTSSLLSSSNCDSQNIDVDYDEISTSRRNNLNQLQQQKVQAVSSTGLLKNLARGSFLRIASDLSGGTPLENIKTSVTVSKQNMIEATRSIIQDSGVSGLWSGTPSRTVEGFLIGALFLAGSTMTKKYMINNLGIEKSIAAICGGMVGGVAQAVVMTPAGMIFTALNTGEDETTLGICKRIIQEKGIKGMYVGSGPMVIRQATNWASRSGFTEIARNVLHLSKYGILGEIGSGVIGGIGSCWNTPIETVRVHMQRDVASGLPAKSSFEYMKGIVDSDGVPGLFRGITPRGVQAIWQTVFMVVFPNMLGM